MLSATEVRKGHVIEYKGDLWMVHWTHHVTPGNLRGFVRIKMRNVKTGVMIEERFSSTDRFEQAILETREVEFSYRDGATFVFLDSSYEQIPVGQDLVDETTQKWLVEGLKCGMTFHENSPIGVDLPPSILAKVVETEPHMKGATAAASYKPAILENGARVTVPPFIQVGETIKVDPREGTYIERA
jgi:elongation factor P